MDGFQSQKILKPIRLHVFLFRFFSIALIASGYTLPDKYFINCGSATNINSINRVFTGDMNSSSLYFTKTSTTLQSTNNSRQSDDLYQTARVFNQNSSYEFEISTTSVSTYLVRLHFSAFQSNTNLSSAVFDVLTSKFTLLSSFSSTNSVTIKEFLLSISSGKFNIYFVPKQSSFAFINGIEVFPAPESFIPDTSPHITSIAINNSYTNILSKVLQTVYRVNVGGQTLTQDNDTLWRNWVPDNIYLYLPETARNSTYGDRIKYVGNVSEYTAPEFVYATAQKMNINGESEANNFNITWNFNVTKNSSHLVRVHLCDIVSQSQNVFIFNLFINGRFRKEIDPYAIVGDRGIPFYFDFVVDSGELGSMSVSVGPNSKSYSKDDGAILNGLEIMEIMEKSGSVPVINREKKRHVLVLVVSVVAGLLFIGVVIVFVFLGLKYRKRKHQDHFNSWTTFPADGGGSSHTRITEKSTNGSSTPRQFNLELKIPFLEIQYATKNFDPKLMIGKGGFGNVYRGVLRNGIRVAVKRAQSGSGQGLPEFQTEVMILSKIRHRHLVSLIGYCDERSEMILVYEYMEKGTLKDHLYNSKLPSLSWKQRLEICIGAANGLHYLHRGSDGGIIHRDIKSTNILLDENHVAKVADFGLSKSGPLDQSQSHVSTAVKGTFGYLDPEYFRTQQLTEKSDVYSFGVLLLEVLCARPAIDPLLSRDQANLAEWGLLCKRKGTIEEIVDSTIKGQIDPNSLRKYAETAEKCLQEESGDRPTMADALWDLEYALQLQNRSTRREPHEDSTTDASSFIPSQNLKRFPSIGESVAEVSVSDWEGLSMEDTQVFSQLKIADAAR